MPETSPAKAGSSPRRAESETARRRRLQAQEVALADREHRAQEALAGLRGALPRHRGHVTPLAKIADDDQRLAIWRARVERLEALLDQTERKRETRAKIVLGTTLLAEATNNPDDPLLARLLAIVDQRVHRPRDRLAIAETLGLAISPLKDREVPPLPDFEAMAAERLSQITSREAAGDELAPRPRRRKKGG